MKINWIMAVVLGLFANTVLANPITITGYDVINTSDSGFGGWTYTYSGTKTPAGTGIYNLTGGSGTLNDGVVGATLNDTQLFYLAGVSTPTITLYLDGLYSLDSLLISGGDFTFSNTIPGALTALDITIGGTTENFLTVGQGNTIGTRYVDDFVDFSGSTLDGLFTNQLILSGFESSFADNRFSIAELSLEGTLYTETSVPEPSSLALLVLGFAGLGIARKKMKK